MSVLVYHKVEPSFEWGVTRCTPGQFERHLRLFNELNLEPCSLGNYLGNDWASKVAITFDDAYESVYDYAYPLLEEIGASFTIFVIAGYVGKWNDWEVRIGGRKFKHLSWDQLYEMKGAEIASHTLTHQALINLNDFDLKRELADSKAILEDHLGREIEYLSLPFGRYDDRALDIAHEAGYKAVCSMTPGCSADKFLVGRYGVYWLDNLKSLRSKLSGKEAGKIENFKLRLINWLSGGTIIVKRWRRKRDALI